MTLATADAEGHPWASPVWFAPDGYRELLWVSAPGARHSLNIATRREVSVVIFDSGVAPAQAVGCTWTAARSRSRTTDRWRMRCRSTRAAPSTRAAAWSIADVRAPEDRRPYRARVSEAWLGRADERIPLGTL